MGLLSKVKKNAEAMQPQPQAPPGPRPLSTSVSEVGSSHSDPTLYSPSEVGTSLSTGVMLLTTPPSDSLYAPSAPPMSAAPPRTSSPPSSPPPPPPARSSVIAGPQVSHAPSRRQSQQQRSAAHPRTEQDTAHIEEKLHQIVNENRLHAWYDAAALARVQERLAGIDFQDLSHRWRIAPELVCDLCSLALFDVVFFIDDSGSMVFEEDGDRIDDLKFILSKAAEVMTLFDDDGVQVRFMNSNVIGEGIRTTDHVNELVERVRFSGMTPLGTQFKSKVIDPIVLGPAISGQMAKPVLTIIITDGEPTREPKDTLRRVIVEAKRTLSRTKYGPGALAIQIGQVGTDIKAQQFLATLDNDPEVGNMIDCTSNYEMESEEFTNNGAELTPEFWLLKLCVGAVDRGYDDAD
ncbi:hypothetical protein HK105_201765 [Polyrhizophydium stewartii]|uniref:VWFA domain-containing protein n=1 Tax=Polyrhizophydium stewartii TaxID=2732419 RepID=A0ABR4NHI8_9FUNG|nr:hypothetical protein HK105_000927 [Polyrhizophydium stewartii]